MKIFEISGLVNLRLQHIPTHLEIMKWKRTPNSFSPEQQSAIFSNYNNNMMTQHITHCSMMEPLPAHIDSLTLLILEPPSTKHWIDSLWSFIDRPPIPELKVNISYVMAQRRLSDDIIWSSVVHSPTPTSTPPHSLDSFGWALMGYFKAWVATTQRPPPPQQSQILLLVPGYRLRWEQLPHYSSRNHNTPAGFKYRLSIAHILHHTKAHMDINTHIWQVCETRWSDTDIETHTHPVYEEKLQCRCVSHEAAGGTELILSEDLRGN